MPLTPGTRLGPYEITAQLGAGGMGEVYRAHDTKLGRDVAIKVLPAALTSDADRLARFTREAQVLASLNHPNIASIHHVEETPEGPALVMELVEGETLADRITRGPVPNDEALPIARQIAEALEAAHEQGIIHRDLKPANIKVRPDGTVKVLDFGLAKLAEPGSGIGDPKFDTAKAAPSMSPTITSPPLMTNVGVLLGTAAYMSPEQAKGRAADKRSDIWAFGCVLYEMLTGKRAFAGDEVSEMLASVLAREPDWTALPTAVAPAIRTLLRRCLEKSRQRRLADIADAKFDLDEAAAPAKVTAANGDRAADRVRAFSRRMVVGSIATVAVLLLSFAALFAIRSGRAVSIPPAERVTIEVGADVSLVNQGAALALSPDGTMLAFVAPIAAGNVRQLFVRRMTQLQAVALAGTSDARDPFFSPDSKWIGFFADGKLKKIASNGGAAVTLCDAPNARGGAWAEDGWITFQPQGQGTPLFRVSAGGGTATAFTKLLTGETTQRWPQVLPSGRGILYTSHNRPAGFDDANIVVLPLPNGTPKIVQRGAYFGRYVASGHLLYVHNGTLFAVPFDLDRLEPSGDAVPVVDSVAATPTAAGINGTGQFAVSNAGTFVYLPGTVANERISPIEWIERTGNVRSMRMMPSLWHDLLFAPDGRRLAVTIDAGLQTDVWIYDWARDTMSRLTFDGAEKLSAVWTPDGRRIAFASRRLTGESTLYWQQADGTGDAQRLTTSAIAQVPTSWHPSGRFLAFVENTRATNLDIFILPMEGDEASGWKPGKPISLVNGPANEVDGMFSPDGRWIAYPSTESGQSEVYVRPFPGPGGRWQLSTGGGAHPTWSRARRELFYETFDEHVMVVPYTVTGESLIGEKPHLWSDQRLVPRPGGRRVFDVHPDGERIAGAVAREITTLKQDKVVLVSQFFDELRALAPAGKR